MSTQTSNAFSFRWRSWFGLAVALFLLYGALNVLGAIFVPLSLYLNGAGGAGESLVVAPEADAAMLGRSLSEVDRTDPRLGAFLVSFMYSMCAYMMAFGLVYVGVTWFALRKGQAWALWMLLIGGLAIIPYIMLISQTYARFGVPAAGHMLPQLVYLAVIILAATALGWFGLRRPRGVPASA